MKIQLYDDKGQQILPITVNKAKRLTQKKKVKPISKNPPRLKLVKGGFGAKLSRKLFLLYDKYGEKTIKSAALAFLIGILVIAGVVAFLVHHNGEKDDPTDLIQTTNPNETQQIVTEPTTTKETTVETTVAESTTSNTTTTTKPTTKKPTEKKQTTKRTTQRTTREETTRSTPAPTTESNGLPEPGGGDDLDVPDPNVDEELPVL